VFYIYALTSDLNMRDQCPNYVCWRFAESTAYDNAKDHIALAFDDFWNVFDAVQLHIAHGSLPYCPL